jgi:hypothetical protein
MRYQHEMADRQAALAAALDDLAQKASQKGPRARGGHGQAATKRNGNAAGP